MRVFGVVFWFLFTGIYLCILILAAAFVLALTVAGIHRARQLVALLPGLANPFGKKVTVAPAEFALSNVVWAAVFGWMCALLACVTGFFFCLSIIGIKHGMQAFTVAKAVLLPFGASIA